MNPLATEFFHALQSLMLDGDPKPTAARKPACRWCGGSGYREDGTPCGDDWDGVIDGIGPEED